MSSSTEPPQEGAVRHFVAGRRYLLRVREARTPVRLQVTDPHGIPLPYFPYRLSGEGTSEPRFGHLDREGWIELESLPAGHYRLEILAGSGSLSCEVRSSGAEAMISNADDTGTDSAFRP